MDSTSSIRTINVRPRTPSTPAPVRTPSLSNVSVAQEASPVSLNSESRQLSQRSASGGDVSPMTGSPQELSRDRNSVEQRINNNDVANLREVQDVVAQGSEVVLPVDDRNLIRKGLIGAVDRARQDYNTGERLQDIATKLATKPEQDPQAISLLSSRGSSLKVEAVGHGMVEQMGNVQKAAAISNVTMTGIQTFGTLSDAASAAVSVVGTIGGGLQILTEAVEMKQNITKLTGAMNRKDHAEAILDPTKRAAQIATLEKEVASLKNPGWFKRLTSNTEERNAEITQKEAAIQSLRDMGDRKPSDEAAAVAQQVIDRAHTGFKAFRIVKNVLGIAAGAVAIAVAVGAMATPVGWALGGAALLATGIAFAYNKYKAGEREDKVNSLVAQRTAIKEDDNLSSVEKTASLKKNMIELMAVSPKHAANEMVKGLKASLNSPVPDNPQAAAAHTQNQKDLMYIATQTLGVSELEIRTLLKPDTQTGNVPVENELALSRLFERGLPLQPKL
jgi:hypothetical protein